MLTKEHQHLKTAEAEIAALPDSPSRADVRNQLERILASPLFRNSKRYTSLLRFSVERRLLGDLDCLKERSLGVEVFGRDPDYNTTQDPVVRTSAVEIRKRLAEYYRQPGHQSEMRIELPAGCYVPEFHPPAAVAVVALPPASTAPPAEVPAAVPRYRPVVVLAAVTVIAAVSLAWWHPWTPLSALDRFWRPVWESPLPVLFSVTPVPPRPTNPATPDPRPSLASLNREAIPLHDVSALVDIAAYLKRMGKYYRIAMSNDIQFQDLKGGPVVFIGPIARRKELQTAGWRFTIERDDPVTVSWIQDRDHPQSRAWSAEVNAPENSAAEAYALVTRFWNETTGQTVVSVAGLSTYATTAAGDFLSDPRAIEQLASRAPIGWDRKNIQIVLAAKRIGPTTGKPQVAATYFW